MTAVALFQNFLFYMFFLMVVLLLNYSDLETAAHSLRLRTQLQRAFQSPERGAVGRYSPSQCCCRRLEKMFAVDTPLCAHSRDEVLPWISSTLLQRLLRDSLLLRDTGSVLVGAPRLQQIQDTQGELPFYCPTSTTSYVKVRWARVCEGYKASSPSKIQIVMFFHLYNSFYWNC